MAQVTTTVVVSFSAAAGAGSVLSAEVDSREDGFNGGKTQFGPGDSPVILVFRTSDVSIDSVTPSTGTIQSVGTGDFLVEEDLQFGDTNNVTLSKPVNGALLTSKWLGRDLGTLTLLGQTSISAPATAVLPGVNRITYNALYQAYRIANISVPLNGENSFPVVVRVVGSN